MLRRPIRGLKWTVNWQSIGSPGPVVRFATKF